VNPAVAVAAGVLVLGEPLTPSIVAAFVLIMAGSLLATAVRPARRRGRDAGLRAAPTPG
jgi:drug/metabolite transporter (DMT)-like permease